MSQEASTIAILGGTGALGTGLARRWAGAGHRIVIGSRTPEKAVAAAQDVNQRVGREVASGLGNAEAASAADIVVLTVPYAHHATTLEAVREGLNGKILIDVTVPLVPPKVSRVQLPPGGSAAKAAQDLLGEGVRVVSAFQNVAAAHLADDEHAPEGDVLVCGNDPEAREVVLGLVEQAGLKGWHAGPIDNSAVAEALTSVLIFLNRRYKIDGAGIRIVGVPAGGSE